MVYVTKLATLCALSRAVSAFAPVTIVKPRHHHSSTIFSSSHVAISPDGASTTTQDSPVEKLHELFNKQITKEMSASQLYLSASIWCESKEFVGMASFMRKESDEERTHALSLVDFANKRDIPINLEQIPAPVCEWRKLADLWRDLLESEKGNTKALYELADAAQAAHDHAVTSLLLPFHTEQVESEGNLKTILAKVHEETLTSGLVYQLDTELGLSANTL